MDHGAAKTEKLNKCFFSLPENLCIRPCENSRCGYGIWALESIPSKTVFGPYNGSFIDNAEEKTKGGFQWKMERDKMTVILDGSDEGGSSWLRYVNYACTKNEQNLTAVQHESQVYYIVTETIAANTQLLVWYHEKISQRESNDKEMSASPRIAQITDGRGRNIQNEGSSKMRQHLWSVVLSSPTTIVLDFSVNPIRILQKNFKPCSYQNGTLPISILTNDVTSSDTTQKSDLVETADSTFFAPSGTLNTSIRPYECEVCHKRYTTKEYLKQHKRHHTGERPYQCTICNKSFKVLNYLKLHQSTHSTEELFELFECNICQMSFKHVNSLKTHLLKHTGWKPFQCTVCGMRFYDSSSLKRHSRIHTGEKPKECKICAARFKDSSSLAKHIRTHRSMDPNQIPCEYKIILTKVQNVKQRKLHECEICHKKYYDRINLVSHMRNHTGERPYECSVCKKRFKVSGHLRAHSRSHSTNRPFQCDTCQMTFKYSSALKMHKLKHTGEKQFKCNVCGKSFYDHNTLRRHCRIHTGEKPYQCQVCPKKFAQSNQLKRHMVVHTGEKPHECQICHAKFKQRSGLLGHKRIHTGEKPFECKICHKKFRFPSPLRLHMKIHTKKAYECEICSNTFTKGSVGCCKKLPFKCKSCNKEYPRYDEFLEHKKDCEGLN